MAVVAARRETRSGQSRRRFIKGVLGGGDGGRARGTSHYIRDPDGNLVEFITY